MKQKSIEFWVGILMLLGIFAFTFMALQVSGMTPSSNPFIKSDYDVTANFTDIGGLKARSAVRIAGVQIGTVEAIALNPQTYEATVTLAINKNIPIPADSSASVTASGILGDNFISIAPGFAAQNLQNGGQIVTTYAATSWQSLISTFMSGSSNSGGTKK